MRLARYSLAQVVPLTLVTAAICAAVGLLSLARGPALLLTLAAPLTIWLWVLWFFRDPERTPPPGEEQFVSPADGTVTDVTPLGSEGGPLGCPGVQVGIFMSVFDVHVNRSPCDATVRKIEHRSGAFMDVRRPEGWHRNENAMIRLEHAGKPVVVRQVAGLIARRIVTDVAPGQAIARGQRIGMIKFGSRVELMVSSELAPQVQVRVGQHVRAGATVLITTRESSHG